MKSMQSYYCIVTYTMIFLAPNFCMEHCMVFMQAYRKKQSMVLLFLVEWRTRGIDFCSFLQVYLQSAVQRFGSKTNLDQRPYSD